MFPPSTPDRSITLFATPRPMRIAIIIDADASTAVADFEEASYSFFNFWGGRFNAVIPSRGGVIATAWLRLLELVDPDCIYATSPLSDSTLAHINRELAPAVLRNADGVARRTDERLNVLGMLNETPARIEALPSAIASRASTLFTPRFHYIFGSPGDDPYKRFIAQNLGTLSEEVAIKDAFRDTDHSEHNLREQDPHELFRGLLGDGSSSRITPDAISALYAHPLAGTGAKYDHCFTVVIGDSIDDLALFRAVKMLDGQSGGRRCAWIPLALAADNDAVDLIRDWIIRSYWTGQNSRRGQVVSCSVAPAGLEQLAKAMSEDWQLSVTVAEVPEDNLGFPEPIDFFLPAAARQDSIAPMSFRLTKAHQCGIVNGSGVIDAHFPNFLENSGRDGQIMVDLEIPYPRNEQSKIIVRSGPPEVWRMPRRQGLAGAFLPSNRLCRIMRNGLPSGVLTRNTDLLPIRMPTPGELFHCCISNDFINEHDIAGRCDRRFIHWRTSDEGQFLAALIDLFGSPFACGHTLGQPFWGPVLREIALGTNVASDVTQASVRRALALLAEHEPEVDIAQTEGLEKAAVFLSKHVRASSRQAKGYSRRQLMQSFGRMRSTAPEGHWYWRSAGWKEYDLDGDLDQYVKADVLRMGIRFRCEECLTDQWIWVEDVASTVDCSGCGATSHLRANPEWSYQVNALAAEAIRGRGIVAVAQALYSVERSAIDLSFVALPCTNLYERNSDQPFTDLDLLYFANRELVIGEVKADPTAFLRTDLDKLAEVAVDLLPNRVVLAAPGEEWPPAIEAQARELSHEQAPIGITWEIRKLSW